MRSLQEGFEKDLAEKDKQREKEVKELQDLLEDERTAAKQAKLDYEEQQQEQLKQLAPHAKLQEEVQEHHHTSPANKQKLRGHVDDCRISEMRSLLAEQDKQREKEMKELQDLLEDERTAAKQAKLDYEEQQQEQLKQLAPHAKLQEEVQEHHHTSPANKQKLRGHVDDCRISEMQSLLAEQDKQREKEMKELQDLLEDERTAAKQAKLDYEEQQQEQLKQLAPHAKLQEEVQEQEKHLEFVTKELEQQRNSWKQRSDQQLQELQELQNQMKKMKEMEAIISVWLRLTELKPDVIHVIVKPVWSCSEKSWISRWNEITI